MSAGIRFAIWATGIRGQSTLPQVVDYFVAAVELRSGLPAPSWLSMQNTKIYQSRAAYYPNPHNYWDHD